MIVFSICYCTLKYLRKDFSASLWCILKNTPKRGADILSKVLKSAVANAENNHGMDKSKLYVAKCFVTPGSHMLKRVMPRGKGSANRILKRTSHITVCVAEKE